LFDRRLKYYAYRVAPRTAAALQRQLRRWTVRGRVGPDAAAGSPVSVKVVAQAAALRERSKGVVDPEQLVDLAFQYPSIAPNQNRPEILSLLRILRGRRLETISEIGSADGGTLFLLSRIAHPEARILSIDLDHNPGRQESFQLLVQPEQRLTCIEGNSHRPDVLKQFRAWIADRKLDFLFIDGDHSYDGVALDHSMYGPHVGRDGVIAFHDIAPDYKTRYGIDTGTDAGGVPSYWSDVRPQNQRCLEFVDHPLQDGRGIGVIVPAEDEGRGPVS
jgi:cephalosporin hydroxylase